MYKKTKQYLLQLLDWRKNQVPLALLSQNQAIHKVVLNRIKNYTQKQRFCKTNSIQKNNF
jgi:hypothetical protein